MSASNATILVVEDERPVLDIMREALLRHGYNVLAAASGEEALAQLQDEGRIDLLVTDVVMRGMNGRELAVKMQERLPQLPVLFVSGYTLRQTGLDKEDAEVPFLQKPFLPRELLAKVQELLPTVGAR